jgi:prevent-host-death family protein
MREMTASDAREHFSEALAAAVREPVFITRHGRRVATLVTSDFYERAVEAQDGDSVPWETVKAELGLL